MRGDPLERSIAKNGNLPRLEAELRSACERGILDAFGGLYVYGIVLRGMRGTTKCGGGGAAAAAADVKKSSLRRQSRDIIGRSSSSSGRRQRGEGDAAHRILVRSMLMYPFNWSAWLDLGKLCVINPSIDEEVEGLLRPISNHRVSCRRAAGVVAVEVVVPIRHQNHSKSSLRMSVLMNPRPNHYYTLPTTIEIILSTIRPYCVRHGWRTIQVPRKNRARVF